MDGLHPDESLFKKIQADFKNKTKIKDIIKKYEISKYIFNTFYREPDIIEKKLKSEKAKEEIQKKQKSNFLKVIKKLMGNISQSCEKVGITRQVFYQWLSEDENFKRSYENQNEYEIDFAESKLMQEINDGNITAIIFFLKTKGKKRGYVENNVDTSIVVNNQPTTIEIIGVDPNSDECPE